MNTQAATKVPPLSAKENAQLSHRTYDIKNPTRARRIIYDGIEGSMRCITIERAGLPGSEVKNVRLHSDIVKELRDRNKIKQNSDLIVTPTDGEAEAAKS